MAHVLIEADKSQNSQLASLRPRRADSVVLVQVQRPDDPRPRKGNVSVSAPGNQAGGNTV